MVTQVTSDVLANSAVTSTKLANGAVTSAAIANNSIDGTKIALGSDAQGDVMYYNGTDWARLAAGTAGQLLQTNGAAANPSWISAATPQFTKNFTSANQTITSASLLTLAHSLGVAPTLMRFSLVCMTIDNGWTVNDVIEVSPGVTASAGNSGFGVYSDATNIYVQFGSLATNPILYYNKTTGASVALTSVNWNMILRAWA